MSVKVEVMKMNIYEEALGEARYKLESLLSRGQISPENAETALQDFYLEKLGDIVFSDDCLSREKRKARARRQPKRGKKENQATFILTPARPNVKGVFENG